MQPVSSTLKQIRRPERGWIRTIRVALGISGPQLARRLGVSKQRVSALEKAEIEDGASLNSIRQAADALNCDLVYALVPREDKLADKVLADAVQETDMDAVKRIRSPEYAGAIAGICRRYHIRRLGLFGSAVRHELTPESDVDLLVEFEQGRAPALPGLMVLQQELTRLLGRKVDVATGSILNNPFRRRAIMRELQEVYAA